MELDNRQTLIIAILVLFLGKYINKRFNVFRKYNIPEAVTGGIISSLIFGLLFFLFKLEINFSTHYRDILLIVFFTSIGLATKVKSIIKGGRILLIFSVLGILYIFVQNYVSISIAKLLNLDSVIGMIAGSTPLQGGHGNVVSWVPVFNEQFKASNIMEIGMTMATFGLIIGGVLGGPVAKYLIKKHNLKSDEDSLDSKVLIGQKHGKNLNVDYDSVLKVVIMLALSIGIGIYIHEFLEYIDFTLPMFATCMLGGLIVANLVTLLFPKLECPTKSPALAITSDLSLGLFLAMAMMALKFWEIGEESLFIIVNLVVQIVFLLLFIIFVVFRLLGKNYTAAVISAGYLGSSMGATPTAMANLAAVTKEHGPSAVAYAVIPIFGAFIIQVSNAFVINIFLKWMG